MPQPIKNYKDLRITSHAVSLHSDPRFATQFSTIVCEWTAAEVDLSKLALDLLGLHGEAALPLYNSLQSGPAQRDAIDALVRANISAERLLDYDEVMKRLKSTRRQRNDVVHGVWALSDDYPDDLILLDISEILKQHALWNIALETQKLTDYGRVMLGLLNLTRYSVKDFGDIIRRLRGARLSLRLFQSEQPLPPPES